MERENLCSVAPTAQREKPQGHARFWERPEVKFLRATRQKRRSRPVRQMSAYRLTGAEEQTSSSRRYGPPIAEVLLTAGILDNSWCVFQIPHVHRGAGQVPAENIPVEPVWVIPAKGVFDVQKRCPVVPVARAKRRRCVSSPASAGSRLARTRGR
jgi:hypothetical protein